MMDRVCIRDMFSQAKSSFLISSSLSVVAFSDKTIVAVCASLFKAF
jgi:hypothetical protein